MNYIFSKIKHKKLIEYNKNYIIINVCLDFLLNVRSSF